MPFFAMPCGGRKAAAQTSARDEMKAFRALADEMLAMDEAGLEAALANGTIFSVI